MHNIELIRIIDKKALLKLIPYSYSTIDRKEKAGNFPKRIQLGARRVGWRLHDIILWIEEKEGRTPSKNLSSLSDGRGAS